MLSKVAVLTEDIWVRIRGYMWQSVSLMCTARYLHAMLRGRAISCCISETPATWPVYQHEMSLNEGLVRLGAECGDRTHPFVYRCKIDTQTPVITVHYDGHEKTTQRR